MGSRIVQAEQRIKLFKALLCSGASHFLRFVQNDNRMICLDNINRFSAAEFIQFRADTTGILAADIECLNIDNHHINVCTLAEVVNLCQILGIVYKETSLLAVIFHEVFLHGIKALANALTDSNARHNHDELVPAVLLVEFEHGLYIHIGLAGAGFHLHVKRAGAHSAGGDGVRQLDIVPCLHLSDILKQLGIIQRNTSIGKAHVKFFIEEHIVCNVTLDLHIPAIDEMVVKRLSCKNADNTLHSLGLVRLYGKFEFHVTHRHPPPVSQNPPTSAHASVPQP